MTDEDFQILAFILFGIAVGFFIYAQSLDTVHCELVEYRTPFLGITKEEKMCFTDNKVVDKVDKLEGYAIFAAVGAFFSLLVSFKESSK